MADTQTSPRERLVFLSWSGTTSKAAAVALREWLPLVIQAAQPWMSELDIEAGARWTPEISGKLNATSVGIICVTPENRDRPWINFEAGALSKIVGEQTRVCPYLIGLHKADVSGPLSQFQLQIADEQGTLRVVEAVNKALGRPLEDSQLRAVFGKWWPDLAAQLDSLPAPDTPVPPRRPEEIWEEILNGVRTLLSTRSSTMLWGTGVAALPAGDVSTMFGMTPNNVIFPGGTNAPQIVNPEPKRKRPQKSQDRDQ